MDESLLPQFKKHIEETGFRTLVGVCSLVFGSYIIAYNSGKTQDKDY
ncbi:hypothetical protein Dtox_2538 [Desulfofarcimen acetoxidans DSM 771]|jgi:hypothetical protein|uniref:Uncharacterized protein n=1 Tax=Desulfofarcimen acetoxidans (strain ATCC 49208 / DSM 771 / KCTC 5769 / VKM B-1644 / 5575) TaxID=485916 RepID=C8W0T5_DESAS|nr:hypothetical protein [Desulfofarcimen acetoxidans]ACV63340.1 hypothetical protein Dtox_2538 [Desulfofarcimen acetoxidans DSM 771]